MTAQRYIADELTHFVGRSLRSQPDFEDLQYRRLVRILTCGCLTSDTESPSARECTEGITAGSGQREVLGR